MSIKQTIEFMVESSSFVMSGFLIAKGIYFGWALLMFGFIMAYLTGDQIKKDVLGKHDKL